jgi:DNA-directed RNA polymerase subunit RPC12/RpoP
MEKRMKKDKYLRARGGSARMLDIHCARCNTWLLKYQKDGTGQLLRCYLNRIFAPTDLVALQHNPAIKEPKDMPNLVCPKCGSRIIGTPMRHEDGRLAFRLMKGTYSKKIVKGE